MTTHLARIIEWDEDLGYGFLAHQTDRIFLHTRNFKNRHRTPGLGDTVLYQVGIDDRKREIAANAVLLRCGGLFHHLKPAWPSLFLVLPVVALLFAPLPYPFWYSLAYIFTISVITYVITRHTYRRSCASHKLPADTTLHLFELIGGWPGSYVAQKTHSIPKRRLGYRMAFWAIVFLWQALALDSLIDWRVTTRVWSGVSPVVEKMLVMV